MAAVNIIKSTGTHCTTRYANRSHDWIVIHYTAGNTSKKGSAKNTAGWFRNPAAAGSADFIVDDEEMVQYNPDLKNYYCWAVGGNYPNKTTKLAKQYYGQASNKNSISIEICSTKIGSTYTFTQKVLEQATALTKYLMATYNIKPDHVIMHHQVSGKQCPMMWTLNDSTLQGWYDWHKSIETKTTDDSFLVKVITDTAPIREKANGDSKIVGTVKKNEIFTIVKLEGKWGKLKSGVGWLNMNKMKKI